MVRQAYGQKNRCGDRAKYDLESEYHGISLIQEYRFILNHLGDYSGLAYSDLTSAKSVPEYTLPSMTICT